MVDMVCEWRLLVDRVGGELEIISKVGVGTTARLTLPRHAPPDWFASQIAVAGYDEVVVVDDDPSIHEVWEGRFAALSEGGPLKLTHYSSLSELMKAAAVEKQDDRRSLFLMDYEFTGEPWNGLQVIEGLNLARNSVLVSSRYDDNAVPQECLRLGVRLLPKFMAPRVPVLQ